MYYPYVWLNYKVLARQYTIEDKFFTYPMQDWNTVTRKIEYPPELVDPTEIIQWGINYGESNPIHRAHLESVTVRRPKWTLAHSRVYSGQEN
jgi:hypothetical protein